MRVPCSRRHVLISEAIPRLHPRCSTVLQAHCEKQKAFSRQEGKKVYVVDIKAPGINHSKLKVCVMQSPMKRSRIAAIDFPSESTMLTCCEVLIRLSHVSGL